MQQTEDESRRSKSPWHVYLTSLAFVGLMISCLYLAMLLTSRPRPSKGPEYVTVLVAVEDLHQGMKLDEPEKLFHRKPFFLESVPPDRIDELSDLQGKILRTTIRQGAHVTFADITSQKEMYKAIQIKVVAETVIGGLVLPGDRVDVNLVERSTDGKVVTSDSLLQQVLVVAVNAPAVSPDPTKLPEEFATVAVAVTAKESEILKGGGKRGDLYVLKRSNGGELKARSDRRIETQDEE